MRESDEGASPEAPSSRMGKAVFEGGKAHQALGVAVKKKRGKRKMISPLPCFG